MGGLVAQLVAIRDPDRLHSLVLVDCSPLPGRAEWRIFIWLRRFESEEERVRLYKAVYESSEWVNELSPRVGLLINRETIRVQRVLPSTMSVLQ